MPAYKDVLKLGQERKGATLLDVGCCFGNDVRKVAADGFPVEQIIASDLKREFWDLGHVLFRSRVFSSTIYRGKRSRSGFPISVLGRSGTYGGSQLVEYQDTE